MRYGYTMNNAAEIRETFERVHGIDRPKHTDVIRAMTEIRNRGVGVAVAVGYVLIAKRNAQRSA